MSDKELCAAVQASNVFIVQYENFSLNPLFNDSANFNIGETSTSNSTKWKPRPIEEVFEIVSSVETSIIKKMIRIYNNVEILASVCYLSKEKIIYVSKGTRIEGITVHFMFGKTKDHSKYLKLLAVIGKNDVETLPLQMNMDTYFQLIWENTSK